MTDFFDFDTLYQGKELGKLIRILVYPNITWQKDLTQDSYVQVIRKMIDYLNRERDDLWFYLILPEYIGMLQFSNVTQLKLPMPTYPNQMRIDFDTETLLSLLDEKFEFDLVFSHLPEHSVQLMNLLYNKTRFRPPMIGYSHWFEFEAITNYEKNVFPFNVLGLLEMEKCYINTEAQKKLVLTEAAKYFNSNIVKRLETILKPFYLGVDKEDLVNSVIENTPKVIVFNHRPQEYKDFNNFMSTMDELYNQRQDFRVWIPLLDKPNRPYVTTEKFNKEGYYDKLRHCRVGFSPKQKYAGWSVATTDGLMNGCPFIMFNADYYQELWSDADFFSTHGEALFLLNKYLDDEEYRNKRAQDSLEWLNNELLYDYSIRDLSETIDSIMDKQRKTSIKTDGMRKILGMIKQYKTISKSKLIKELKWGAQIPWSPYRQALINHPKIEEEKTALPIYYWRD